MQKLSTSLSAFKHYLNTSAFAFSLDLKSLRDIKNKEKRGEKLTFTEWNRASRIKSDIRKFIPYVMFLTIPGSGLVFLPYILLFPDFVPTQFVKAETWNSHQNKLIADQLSAFEFIKSSNTKSEVEKLAINRGSLYELSVDKLAALVACFQAHSAYDPFWFSRTSFWLKSKFNKTEDTFKPWIHYNVQSDNSQLKKYALIKALQKHFSLIKIKDNLNKTGRPSGDTLVSEESLAKLVATHLSESWMK